MHPMPRTSLHIVCILFCAALACAQTVSLSGVAYSTSRDKPGLTPDSASSEPIVAAPVTSSNISVQCRSGQLDPKKCKFHWRGALLQSFEFLAIQHTQIMIADPSWKHWSATGNWWDNYMRALHAQRFGRWGDGDEFIVNYVAHPMMGAVAGFIQVQNEPNSMGLEISKSGAYWKSRARAVAWSAAYTAQWEVGPISEASLQNEGGYDYIAHGNHGVTNGAGLVDFVMTPVGGGVWMVGEDALDKVLITRLERVSRNPAWLLAISILNPNRSAANLLRFKMPWHRDTRTVRPPMQ